MIKVIAFDLWQTLAYRDVPYSTTQKILELTGLKIPKEKFTKIFESSLQLKIWNSKFDAYKNLCVQMRITPNQDNVNLVMKVRDDAEARTKLYDHTIPLLKELKSQGFKTGLISNSSVFAIEVLKRLTNLLDYIDYPVFSFEVGAIKPSKKIYKEFLRQVNCQPDEVLMIGDKAEDDIIPSKKIGMRTILFKNYGQLKKDIIKLQIFIN